MMDTITDHDPDVLMMVEYADDDFRVVINNHLNEMIEMDYGLSTGITVNYTIDPIDCLRVLYDRDYVRLERYGRFKSQAIRNFALYGFPECLKYVYINGCSDYGNLHLIAELSGNVECARYAHETIHRQNKDEVEKGVKYAILHAIKTYVKLHPSETYLLDFAHLWLLGEPSKN